MEKRYYQEYYRIERDHWWFKARNRIILHHLKKIIPSDRNIEILNVGVATGYSSELLSDLGNVKSVEYDKECCEFIKNNLSIDIIHGSILDLPFGDNRFDLICALDVLEHIEDDQLAVSELKRVCKKEGIVCISVPAFQFLWGQHDIINHHYRRYIKKNLLKLFENDGRFIYHSYYCFWLFIPIAVFRILSSVLKRNKNPYIDAKSDFGVLKKIKFIHSFLFRLFHSEIHLISRFIHLPFGSSILLTWKK